MEQKTVKLCKYLITDVTQQLDKYSFLPIAIYICHSGGNYLAASQIVSS